LAIFGNILAKKEWIFCYWKVILFNGVILMMESKMKAKNKLFFMQFEVITGDIELTLNHTITAKNKDEAVKIAGDYVSNYYAGNDEENEDFEETEEETEEVETEEKDPWRQASFQDGYILASLQTVEEMTAKEIVKRMSIN
jgi:hypothetical protein